MEALTNDWANNKLFETADTWAEQVRQLVQLGKPAVPALTRILDRTDADLSLRLLGFTLRAIGDPRAIPALIRTLPRTLRPPASDCGVPLKDPVLLEFMRQQCVGEQERDNFGMGRPVREIASALEKLAGTTQGEQELFHTSLDGGRQQRDLQRFLFNQVARRWASWWRLNWSQFVNDPTPADIEIPALPSPGRGPGSFPAGSGAKLAGGHANVTIGAVEEESAWCFIDLDTGRRFGRPNAAAALETETISVEAACAWAAGEGMDLVGVKYRRPGSGTSYYMLRGLGLQAWQIPNERWPTIGDELRSGKPLNLGRPASNLLMHCDDGNANYNPVRKATFPFITREGNPGILRVVGQVINPNNPETARPLPTLSNDIEEVCRRRYGIPSKAFEANPDQDLESCDRFPGVKIEYRFFYNNPEP